MSFSSEFKSLRVNRGLTQRELAKELGVSPSLIAMYENGSRKPDFYFQERIAEFFNVSIDSLHGNVSQGQESMEIIERRLKDLDIISLFAVRDYINYLIVKNGGDPNDN